MHEKSCHKQIEVINNDNVSKKRKSTDDIPSSRKKTKNDAVSKKVGKVAIKKTKEKTFCCDECDYETKSKQSLKRHKETSCKAHLD